MKRGTKKMPTQEQTKQRSKPVFSKVVDKETSSGQLTARTNVSLTPYNFIQENGAKNEGYFIQITVNKFGYGDQKAKFGQVTLDPKNADLRKAIEDAYATYDELMANTSSGEEEF